MASLDPGKRLGPYEIIAAIGAGGMGEVYRARDSRIGREVAIKILPAEYSENQDRLARFEHEARAAGMLNHPNILAVYDVGNENSCSYLVTELLEGETLRHKLEQGALPTRKALEYATQLAGGLAAAHQKGIVHRDLKPENIFVTRDGRLKILDFGLAKLIQPEFLPANDISNMATGLPQSLPGMILGTIGYMSPEQVRGQTADSRSDLFTFGEILYEMLAGNRAFHGQTPADTMSAILHKDVPALPQQPDLLAPERILRRCLEKDPDHRFQSAQDLAFALEALSGSSGSQTSLQGTAFTAPSKTRLYPWIIAALLFLAAIAAWGSRLLEKKAQAPLIQLELMGPKDHILNGIPVISPDGSAVALTATNKNGDSTLWVRSFDSSILREMPATEGATTPFWSADSRSIGFFAQGRLKKLQISGGPAQDLSEAPDPRGGTWNQQDVIVFAPYPGDGLYKISAGGGSAVRITSLDKSSGESSHRFPSFLPDGIHYLYFGWGQRGTKKAGVYLGSLNSKEKTFLFPSDHAATFAPPGYLIFNQNDTLLVQPFDTKKLQLSGSPFPVLQQVWFADAWAGSLAVSASSNSTLTAIRGVLLNDLRTFDRSGKSLGSARGPADYADAGSFSPDGKRIALDLNVPPGTNSSIWLYDFASNSTSRFSFDASSNFSPVWSPNGEKILFASNRTGPFNLYAKDSSGAGNEELVVKSEQWLTPDDWTASPETIIYTEIDPSTKFDLWVLPLTGDRKPFPFLKTPANESQAKVSSDGNWIAYCSDESGQPEVYVQPYLKKIGGRWQVSVNGGTTPKWRADGKELFYLTTDGKVMSLEVKTGTTFEFASPKVLFQTRLVNSVGASTLLREYEPSPDGQKFLVRTHLADSEFRPISVIMNWPALLEKKN